MPETFSRPRGREPGCCSCRKGFCGSHSHRRVEIALSSLRTSDMIDPMQFMITDCILGQGRKLRGKNIAGWSVSLSSLALSNLQNLAKRHFSVCQPPGLWLNSPPVSVLLSTPSNNRFLFMADWTKISLQCAGVRYQIVWLKPLLSHWVFPSKRLIFSFLLVKWGQY